EHRCVGADAQRQGGNRRQREAARLQHRAQSKTKVLQQGMHSRRLPMSVKGSEMHVICRLALRNFLSASYTAQDDRLHRVVASTDGICCPEIGQAILA